MPKLPETLPHDCQAFAMYCYGRASRAAVAARGKGWTDLSRLYARHAREWLDDYRQRAVRESTL